MSPLIRVFRKVARQFARYHSKLTLAAAVDAGIPETYYVYWNTSVMDKWDDLLQSPHVPQMSVSPTSQENNISLIFHVQSKNNVLLKHFNLVKH